MKSCPLPVFIVGILFIVAGCVGIAYHAGEFFEPNHDLYELVWVLLLRLLAVVCGFLLLFQIGWARWLAIAWMMYHVIISAFNSRSEMISHIVFLIVISVLLFLPLSSRYFNSRNKQ